MRVTSSILFTATLLLGNVLCCGAHNVEGRITCDGYGLAGVAESVGYEIVLTGTLHGCPQILADCNADDEISIADVNSVIDLILKQ